VNADSIQLYRRQPNIQSYIETADIQTDIQANRTYRQMGHTDRWAIQTDGTGRQMGHTEQWVQRGAAGRWVQRGAAERWVQRGAAGRWVQRGAADIDLVHFLDSFISSSGALISASLPLFSSTRTHALVYLILFTEEEGTLLLSVHWLQTTHQRVSLVIRSGGQPTSNMYKYEHTAYHQTV